MSGRQRESRRDRELREAREEFCRLRRHEDRLIRWLAWLEFRSLLEGWAKTDRMHFRATSQLLVEADSWRRGWRPPTSFGAAMAEAKRQRAAGRLWPRGDGS